MWTWILQGLVFLAAAIPWRLAQKLGALLGLVWFQLVRIRRRTVFENLALALPEAGERHLEIARNAYRHFGISAFEFLKIKGMNEGDFKKRITACGMERYEAALARGKGVIAVTAHFGNFDLLAASQPAFGIPLAIVSRDLHQRGVSRFWMEMRQGKGLEIFPDRGAARQVVEWLRAGKVLGLTVDQRTDDSHGGIRSDFLGNQVWTTPAPATLAVRTGAALLPVRLVRREDGDHRLIVEPEITWDDVEKDQLIETLTERINAVVGRWVKDRPEQWMWLHRRFLDSWKTEA